VHFWYQQDNAVGSLVTLNNNVMRAFGALIITYWEQYVIINAPNALITLSGCCAELRISADSTLRGLASAKLAPSENVCSADKKFQDHQQGWERERERKGGREREEGAIAREIESARACKRGVNFRCSPSRFKVHLLLHKRPALGTNS
jgi:hypothetical protein